jgi:hypothetical protein
VKKSTLGGFFPAAVRTWPKAKKLRRAHNGRAEARREG